MTSADIAAWVAAAGTWVIGVGGIGAVIYAARAWGDQARELKAVTKQVAILGERLQLARNDSRRQRTPVLHAEISAIEQGSTVRFRLEVRLSSSEPLASLRVAIEEARVNDSPVGFTPGQTGVERHPDQDVLPPGWRDDVLRHEAVWDESLEPGGAATWDLGYRQQTGGHRPADPEKIRFRARCTAPDGESWSVGVPVTVAPDAARALRAVSGPDPRNTVG